MITINPTEVFPLTYLIKDHTDSATYYVQSVIRDAKTNATIDTVNLTNRGNRRFMTLWKAPIDNAYSSGKFVTVTTTVYTDSGYTTKSENHYEEFDQYLIQQRWEQQFSGGGSGASTLKEEDLRRILAESLPPAPVLGSTQPTQNNDQLADAILTRLENAVGAIPRPEKPERVEILPVDLTSLEDGLDRLEEAISNIHIPQPEKVNLSPLIATIHQEQQTTREAMRTMHAEAMKHRDQPVVIDRAALAEIVRQIEQLKTLSARNNYLNQLKARYV